MTTLQILHLYPHELGINGDVGNVMALVQRLRWRGHDAQVHAHNVGETLPDHADIVLIGSGPLSAQRAVHADVLGISSTLRAWREQQIPILAIAGGWQLLGEQIVMGTEHLNGAGVFPTRAVLGEQRRVSETLVRTEQGLTLTGFENHSATTTLLSGSPLGAVFGGFGNDGTSEGVVVDACIGTHLHGPLLPMNPELADRILSRALATDDRTESPQCDLADRYAELSRAAIAHRLGCEL